MAEESCTGAWWNGWIQAAKDKSAEALDFVKKDLAEFTTTVQADTQKAVVNVKENINQDSVTTATQKAKAGVTSFLGEITKVLTVEAEDKRKPNAKTKSQPIFSRAKARLNAIQVDEGTYVNDPIDDPEQYAMWCKEFQIDKHKGDISELLVANVEVRSLYTQLVPSTVTHADFWQRYFYKVEQLEKDEARREALKKRAEDSTMSLTWDDSDEDDWVDMSSSPPPDESHMPNKTRQTQAPQPPPSAESQRLPTLGADIPAVPPPQQTIQHDQDDVYEVLVNSEDKDAEADSKLIPKNVDSNVNKDSVVKSENTETENGKVEANKNETDNDVTNVTEKTENVKLDSSTDTLTTVTPDPSTSTSEISESRDTNSSISIEVLNSDETKSQASPEIVTITEADKTKASETDIKTREKGDLVVVGSSASSDRTSPSSANSDPKETDEDDWEHEFDVTEDDLKAIAQAHTSDVTPAQDKDEDWDDWE